MLILKTPEWRHWRDTSVFTVNFEHISHYFHTFHIFFHLLLTFIMYLFAKVMLWNLSVSPKITEQKNIRYLAPFHWLVQRKTKEISAGEDPCWTNVILLCICWEIKYSYYTIILYYIAFIFFWFGKTLALQIVV